MSSANSSFGHLLVFDLSKLGTAYQIINEFVDDVAIRVFEVSPVADRAVVMLQSQDLISAQVILSQARSLFHNDILQSALIANVAVDVIATYLSQKQAPTLGHYMITECNFFSAAFIHASLTVNAGVSLVDFRALRTNPANLILTFTDKSLDRLLELSSKNADIRTTFVKDVKAPLRSYFEIVK